MSIGGGTSRHQLSPLLDDQIPVSMFMVYLHCESSPGSFDERNLSARRYDAIAYQPRLPDNGGGHKPKLMYSDCATAADIKTRSCSRFDSTRRLFVYT